MADLQQKDEQKAQQLKDIEEMTANASEKLLKMSYEDIKEFLRKIREVSMPDYLPSPQEETTESQQSSTPPKKSTRVKSGTKKAGRTVGPETVQPKNAALRNRPAIPPGKPTGIPRKK